MIRRMLLMLLTSALAGNLAASIFYSGDTLALPIGANSGTIEFRVVPTGAVGAGAPVFDGQDRLLDPGGGFPSLNVPATVNPFQVVNGNITPGLSAISNKNPPNNVNALFGSGNMTIRGIGFPGGGGIFWGPFLVSDTAVDGKVSYIDGQADATFTNTSPFEYQGRGGAFLSVFGHIGLPGGFVGAALKGTIGGKEFDPIVIAFDAGGPGADGVRFANNGQGNATTRFQGLNVFPNGIDFTAYGVDLLNDLIKIPAGGNAVIDATLTIFADPSSGLEFIDLPPGVLRPDFGAFSVPEPSELMLLVIGLLGLALSRSSRMRL